MKKLTGMVPTSDGSYVCAVVEQTTSGWEVAGHKTLTWSQKYAGVFKGCGFNLGINCNWIRVIPDDMGDLIDASSDSEFTVCVEKFDLEMHKEELENNLLGIYPEDAFMCTIPLYLSTDPKDTFLSVFSENGITKVAVIVNKKLSMVFTVPNSYPVNLFIKRIKHYWGNYSKKVFPDTIYFFNNQKFDIGTEYSIKTVSLPTNDTSVVKCIGLAFCELDDSVPQLCGATGGSSFRKIRAAILAVCTIVIVATALAGGVFLLLNHHYVNQINEHEKEYRSILSNNSEIKEIIAEGEKLSDKLLRISKISSTPTNWGRFLHLLGSVRPEKLYFEKLGSEQVTNANMTKVALAGWAENEIIVTDLIKKLNASDLITHTSLSSVERDKKHPEICRFKIICMLKLSNS